MIKHLLTSVIMFAMIMVGVELLFGSTILADLLFGRMYWLPVMPLHELPEVIAPIYRVLPVLPLLSLICMLAAGLISLVEQD